MSGVVHGLRKSQQAVDIYPIVNDEGHVTYDQTSRNFSVAACVIATEIVTRVVMTRVTFLQLLCNVETHYMSPTTRLWSCYAMRSESAMQVSLPRLSILSFFCFVLRILLFLFTQLFSPNLVPCLLVRVLLMVFPHYFTLLAAFISTFLLLLFFLYFLFFSFSFSALFLASWLFCFLPSCLSPLSFYFLLFFFYFSVIITVITVASRWYTTTSLRTPDFLKTLCKTFFNLLTVLTNTVNLTVFGQLTKLVKFGQFDQTKFGQIDLTKQSLMYMKKIFTL